MNKIKLNLGSGPAGIDGWINYDSGILPLLSKFPMLRHFICNLGLLPKHYDVKWPKINLVDIRKSFPLEDNSVDYIYCSQVLEHFERHNALRILKESLRVLKSGGIMRISVPNIAKMFTIYQELSKSSPKMAAKEINLIWWGYEKDGPAPGIFTKFSRLFIRDHQWHYDQASLKETLEEAGFSKINIQRFGKGKVDDLKTLELSIHKQHAMYFEAIK